MTLLEIGSGGGSRPGAEDLNIRILGASAAWIADRHGRLALERIATRASIDPEWFGTGSFWVSVDQVECYLEALHELCERDDELFLEACRHHLEDGYGPMLGLLRALSLPNTARLATRTMPLVSKVSSYEARITSGEITLTYRTSVSESRLMCMSRWATFERWPCIGSLKRFELSHPSCVARGDEACVYAIRYAERDRAGVLPAFALLGLLVTAGGIAATPIPWPYLVVSLPTFFLGAGLWLQARRTVRREAEHEAHLHSDLQDQVRQNAEANAEIVALQRRQQAWTELVDAQVQDRTEVLETVVEGLRTLQEERELTLRGMTHDLRNPLTVLKTAPYHLQRSPEIAAALPHLAEDIEIAVGRMERLLDDLMQVAMREQKSAGRLPTSLKIGELGDRLERRLRALVLGKEIRVSVLTTREAPAQIEVDLLIFDRILDNLFTNAAKYTERGSILLEVGGRPGTLTLKLSDTGRGIAEEEIAEIFEPGGSKLDGRAPNSFGVGLSVVLRLAHQAGAKIEVMSRPSEGTTFWVHFPVQVPERARGRLRDEEVLAEVVTIRRT